MSAPAKGWLAAELAEIALPIHRPKLWFGLYSGFAIGIGFGVLAVATVIFNLSPYGLAFVGLVAVKLVTNSVAYVCLARDRFVMPTQSVNSTADVILLTIAIYLSGGPYSPLLPTYVILIAVHALLTNLGVTLLIGASIVGSFTAMIIAMAGGVLPPTPIPGAPGEVPSIGYAVTAIVYVVFVVGAPAYFGIATMRLLRNRERDLETKTAQLIQAATQRSQFVASMTHELRTPIHGVQGLADVIAAGVYGPVTAKQIEACASIKRGAQSLIGLIDDVLQLTRAEAGKIEARPSAVDVSQLIDRVTTSVSWVVGTKKLHLSLDVATDLPIVHSDERWLAHVLVNLLGNAVKFTPEGGRVTVHARERGTRGEASHAVELAVEDTGIGIRPQDRAAIFEPFRQATSGDARGYGGVGLGLALVARLTELLAAEVELESEPGNGSTFRVVVPVEWRGGTVMQLTRPPRAPSVN